MGCSVIAALAFMLGFAVLIIFVSRYYLYPALEAAGQATPQQRKLLAAHAWLLMALIALLCNALVCYAAKGATARSLLLFIMPLLISTAFLLIADIDSPRGGVIRVTAQNLVSLSEEIAATAPPSQRQ